MTLDQFSLLVSVDLDMWYHCRWATGSRNAYWSTTEAAIVAYYGEGAKTNPPTDFPRLLLQVLDIFDQFNVKATFFCLGEVAKRYPKEVKIIPTRGHELASHSMHHIDAALLSESALRQSLDDSKRLLQDLIGLPISGFRFPNLVFDQKAFSLLVEVGYRYDSSVCFSRKLLGKFGAQGPVLNNPYTVDPTNAFVPGLSNFWEFPIPVFPGLRLPGGSGIALRLLGRQWVNYTIYSALRRGTTCFYFHPYELERFPALPIKRFWPKFFMRGLGSAFRDSTIELLREYSPKIRYRTMSEWISLPQETR